MSARPSLARRILNALAWEMPDRYQRTRGLLLLAGVLCAWTDNPDPIRDAVLVVISIVCFVGYLIAGLLKPLHDRSRNNGRGM